ncbi:MAG: glycosyltransferase [Candidatus Liptonbacteria bacterium]
MKIIYTGIQAENYDPKRKYSFEYNNFYLTLKGMPGVSVIEYPFDRILEIGKKRFNEELFELVKKEEPDILFTFMFSDELDTRTLNRIRTETKTKTVAWFADDYWRFFNYSRHHAPHFSYAVTTYNKAVEWYRAAGYNNAILSQWACNTHAFMPRELPQDIDVSFIGQRKPQRAKVIDTLANRGVKVEAYGFGWPNGRVAPHEMQNIIGRSKINLNLNVRGGLLSPAVIGRLVLKRSLDRLVPDFHIIDNIRAYLHFPTPHIHARPFELSGMKAFVISGYASGMEQYYEDDKEMVFYRGAGRQGIDDLTDKIRYYLSHDAERESIRAAGYARTIRDHTYEERFKELFRAMGF